MSDDLTNKRLLNKFKHSCSDDIPTLDLHGYHIKFLEIYINRFIDDMITSNLEIGIIIVGISSGVLKEKAYKCLKDNYNVDEVVSYPPNGAIIFELKKSKTKNIQSTKTKNYNKFKTADEFEIIDIFKRFREPVNIKRISLSNLFGVFNYKVSFENNNVFVVHAPNGCGKSHFLNYIRDFLNNNIEKLYYGPFENFEILTNENNYKIDAFKTNNLNIEEVPKCNYISNMHNYNFEKNINFIGFINENKIRVFQEIMDEFFCFEKRVQIKTCITNKEDILITYNIDSNYTNPSIYKKGDNIPISKLSSGEIFIIKLFYKLIFDLAYNSFVIIDEPELYLHIEWQEMMIKNIVRVANTFDVYILIATHSPYIVNNPNVEVGAVEYEEK